MRSDCALPLAPPTRSLAHSCPYTPSRSLHPLATCPVPASLCRFAPGCSPDTTQIPESSIRSFADGYLSAGETVFNLVTGQAVTSSYFKKAE